MIRRLIRQKRYTLSKHAVQRKSLRKITNKEIEEAVFAGAIFETNPDDKPYPSYLIQGTTKEGRSLNVAVAFNERGRWVIIITVYEFDEDEWTKYLRRKERRN